jgi:hypothetical protein
MSISIKSLTSVLLLIFIMTGCTKQSARLITGEQIDLTLKELQSPSVSSVIKPEYLSRFLWECRSAQILFDESLVAKSSGRQVVREELERRARELIVPAMKSLVETAQFNSKGKGFGASEKELVALAAKKFPPAVVLVTSKAMAKAAQNEAEIARLAEAIQGLPSAYPDARSAARETGISIAAEPLEEFVEPYPELVRWTLYQFYSSGPGFKFTEKQKDFLVFMKLFSMSLPGEKKDLSMLAGVKYDLSLGYSRIFVEIPEAKDQVKMLPSLREQLQRRAKFYAQLTKRELCDYTTSLWIEEGTPFSLGALTKFNSSYRNVSSTEAKLKDECAGETQLVPFPEVSVNQ